MSDMSTRHGYQLATHLEAETDILVPAAVLAANLLDGNLGVVEDGLLLERLLDLLSHVESCGEGTEVS